MKGGESKDGPRAAVLIALCAAGFTLFNFPMLRIWENGGEILGLPMLPVALFAIWGGLIAALIWVNERRRDE